MAISNFLKNKSFLGTGDHIVSNLIAGGQNGYGFRAGAFDAATPLALPPAVIVVLQTPTMWDKTFAGEEDSEGILRQTVKAMFECHAKSVSGIDISYTLDSQDQPIGHDGQTFKVPTTSKRTEPTPSFTWPEVTGNLVWNIIRRWIWDISDPDTNAGFERMDNPDSFTMSAYALTFLTIQFDQTMIPDRIIDAAIITNVFPQATGELGIKRELGQTQVMERSITFNGYMIHNEKTREIGLTVANELKLRGTSYWSSATPNMTDVDSGNLNNEREGGRGIVDGGSDTLIQNKDGSDDSLSLVSGSKGEWTKKNPESGS